MRSVPLVDALHPSWARALAPVAHHLDVLDDFLDDEVSAGHDVLPPRHLVMRAFERPLEDVRVLVVGQDPYPTPGHAHGLAFSCEADVRPLPRSLRNILTELHDDTGQAAATSGDLSAWASRGILLLNRVLTVRAGEAGSHRGRGWEHVTDRVVEVLDARDAPLVAILWGKDAERLAPRLAHHPVLVSAHPSPLAAHRGFFGSRPFTRASDALVAQGAAPLDWSLPEGARWRA
ncbi:uracil-DNA glycosylase [Sanguibacter sp. A247]|uniref:uracil-DNA glycosylase n=1 Tax=unclassified Sanguibacter TaxID=2645534 RepID=UPI003FD812A5